MSVGYTVWHKTFNEYNFEKLIVGFIGKALTETLEGIIGCSSKFPPVKVLRYTVLSMLLDLSIHVIS